MPLKKIFEKYFYQLFIYFQHLKKSTLTYNSICNKEISTSNNRELWEQEELREWSEFRMALKTIMRFHIWTLHLFRRALFLSKDRNRLPIYSQLNKFCRQACFLWSRWGCMMRAFVLQDISLSDCFQWLCRTEHFDYLLALLDTDQIC